MGLRSNFTMDDVITEFSEFLVSKETFISYLSENKIEALYRHIEDNWKKYAKDLGKVFDGLQEYSEGHIYPSKLLEFFVYYFNHAGYYIDLSLCIGKSLFGKTDYAEGFFGEWSAPWMMSGNYANNFKITKDNLKSFTSIQFNHWQFNEIDIPENIDDVVLLGCDNVTKVTFNGDLNSVNIQSEMIEEINLPEYVSDIFFMDCKKLKQLIVPEGVEKIEEDTFGSCKSLKRLVLPKSLSYIDYGSFRDTALNEIEYRGTMEEWNKLSFTEDTYWRKGSRIKRVKCADGVIRL